MTASKLAVALAAAALGIAGCGSDESPAETTAPAIEQERAATTQETTATASAARGKTIRLGSSQFGSMLFDARKQAIYIFQRDRKNKSNCYGECARLWPPVITKAKPRAGKGVKASLLGTTRRRDGKLQVTYAGQPLYFYAHEGPGEVECHNVFLNGGLWWVVGPSGKRRR